MSRMCYYGIIQKMESGRRKSSRKQSATVLRTASLSKKLREVFLCPFCSELLNQWSRGTQDLLVSEVSNNAAQE